MLNNDPCAPYIRDKRFDRDGLHAWRDRFGLLRWLPPDADPNAE